MGDDGNKAEETPVEEPTVEETSAEENSGRVDWPLPAFPLPAMIDVQPMEGPEGEPLVVLGMYTSNGALFGAVTREQAIALSSRIKKIAQTGPPLIIP